MLGVLIRQIIEVVSQSPLSHATFRSPAGGIFGLWQRLLRLIVQSSPVLDGIGGRVEAPAACALLN